MKHLLIFFMFFKGIRDSLRLIVHRSTLGILITCVLKIRHIAKPKTSNCLKAYHFACSFCIKSRSNNLRAPLNGKTSIMRLLKTFSNHKSDYKIKTCREISFEFAKQGNGALLPYTHKLNNQNKLTGYCFDDLGAEQQIKHFGNAYNVMAEILISRYEDFVEKNSLTHIITNLSASEIENLYDNRLRSRMRNKFNVISFCSNSKDKR